MGSDRASDSPGLGDLPMEILALVVAHLTADRDLCRARTVHRCFHASPQGEVEKRLARWRGQKTQEQFCAAGLVEALAILADRGAILGPACVWAAVEHGHCNVLAFLVAWGVPLAIAPRRRMGIVRAPERFADRPTRRAVPETDLVVTAASGGHLDVIRFLCANGVVPAPGPAAIDSAAANGHLDVVRFLNEHRCEGCTEFAMTKAAIHGHLGVVAYLHEHRTEGCADSAYDEASILSVKHRGLER